MEKKYNDERWELQDNDNNEEEEEEALSLSDLPLIYNPRKANEEEGDKQDHNTKRSPHSESQIKEQDFDFCSKFKESEMCAADDIFFQGSILPLRHSISFEHHHPKLSDCRSISRSETMDRNNYYSRELVSSISSRSSSINSNSSSSSSASTITTVPSDKRCHKPKLPPRNQFHYYSHPSPSPRVRNRQGGVVLNSTSIYTKSHSSAWNIFKLGLVKTPPEILNACPCPKNVKNFGSRNSASSNGSIIIDKKKKKKQMAGLFGGCKCTSSSSVDEIRDSRVVVSAINMKRSGGEGKIKALFDDESRVEMMMLRSSEKVKKKHMSHHRTLQWLKQLSIEGANSDDHDQL